MIFLWLESLISGIFPLVFLIICGVFLTLKTRGWQFKNLIKSLRFAFVPVKKSKDGISSFSAVCNSLASTVGTGNIAGVAAAISLGGPGAVFWMWISAFLGMIIKAVEITVAVKLRKNENGCFRGGPLVYFEKVFSAKAYFSTVFALVGVMASFCTGNITQVNASVKLLGENNNMCLMVGVVFGLVSLVVISGGVKKISSFTTVVLPFMAILYIVLCLGVIIKNYSVIGRVFALIIKGAFSPKSVTSGAVGSVLGCVITGAQKGVFSNEAGLGTAGMAHSLAVDANQKTQGLFGIFEVFVDTLVICTLTALTILSSGVIINYNTVASSELVAKSLGSVYGEFSTAALWVMLCLFAISSVIGWAAYGLEFSKFLWGEKGKRFYLFIYPLFCVFGSVINVSAAFRLAEFFGGIMLCINLYAVFSLSDDSVKILKGEDYESQDRKNTNFFKRW